MKTFTLALTALAVDISAAQFFVLYGKNTVAQRADPIVNPGGVAQHVHDFFGSNSIAPDSTYASLQKGTCASMGNAQGSSINEDRSAYWHPSLYAKLNNGSYFRIPPVARQMYYKNVGTGTPRVPFEFPKGFRMVAGTNTRRAPAPHTPSNTDEITQWICHAPTWNQGASGGFPSGVTSCPDYPYFNGAIHFPHCWNGNAFDQAHPSAHMSYPIGDIQAGSCPSTHPIRLPHIFMENDFYLENVKGQFQTDSFVLANGDPTGFGWHADFFNGWTPGVLSAMLTGPNACYSEDVGSCTGPTFDVNSRTDACITQPQMVENIEGPFAGLPGCNPISTVNPSVDRRPCALGVNGGTARAVQSSTSMTTSAAQQHSAAVPPKASTASTTTGKPTVKKPAKCPAGCQRVSTKTITNVSTVTMVSTVTASPSVPGQASNRKRAKHMHGHGYAHKL